VAIRRLYEGYNDSIDCGDADSWAIASCEDGVFERPTDTYSGRDELASFVRKREARTFAQPVTDLRHWNSGIRLNTEGDRLVGEFRLLVSARDREPGSPLIMTIDEYTDVVAWDGKRWRSAHRTLRRDQFVETQGSQGIE
jgi:hypothetical protein